MKKLNKLLYSSADFKEMILNPTITKDDKKNVIFKIADQNNFSETFKKFLGFVAIKNRLFFLDQIVDSFSNLASAKRGELKAKLISSKKLSQEELKNIQKELSKDFETTINIDYIHDPDLIAGLTIQVGSIMVDTSIKNKLKQLEKNMIEA